MDLPLSYYLSVLMFAGLISFGAFRWNTAWALPYIAVLGMIAAWYFVEPFYFPDLFASFETEYVDTAYTSVLIFISVFSIAAPAVAQRFKPKPTALQLSRVHVSAKHVFLATVALWLVLLAYGTLRMRGDLLGALFPIEGRAGVQMWSRAGGSDAGASGFIVSTAAYLYNLSTAAFGLLLFLLPKGRYRVLAVVLIMISWPYSFLLGARNIALATVLPCIISYVLFSRQSFWLKIPFIILTFLCLDLAFKVMIEYRNVGFEEINLDDAEGAQHLGLNMASELVYCVKFIAEGTMNLSYGVDYLAEALSIIPRAVWPGKPLIGVDYSIARGFGTDNTDIGVFATIASGILGQSVLAFGAVFGPAAAAFLMSLWVGLLARFRAQGTPLRLALYLVGLGLTFNLGRDITMQVLWPLAFAYVGVRLVEWRAGKRHDASPDRVSPYRQSGSYNQNKIIKR